VLALAGISHKTAPVELREQLAFSPEELSELLPVIRERFGPAVVVSTCNRTEVYLSDSTTGTNALAVLGFLGEWRGASTAAEIDHLYALNGADAVRHLFRVAAGLESMILGESQILGQVRQAVQIAQQAGAADPLLIRLFHHAAAGGRRLRSGAGMAGSSASVSAAAVELARERLRDLSDKCVLVVSAGEAAKLTAWSLSRSGAGRIVITGRTLARAQRLAAGLGATAIAFQQLAQGIAEADIVVSSTGAREFCIDRAMIESAVARRGGRPLLMIDLAVPRDIDPSARSLAGVSLYDIDDLQPLIDGFASQPAWTDSDSAIEGEVDRFMSWWESQRVIPTIVALRGRAEDIRQAELAKTLGRLPNLSLEERRRIDALTSAIVKKLLHQPIMSLKDSQTQPERVDAIRELFALYPTLD
jgi:glutamyl-tRNA reductase